MSKSTTTTNPYEVGTLYYVLLMQLAASRLPLSVGEIMADMAQAAAGERLEDKPVYFDRAAFVSRFCPWSRGRILDALNYMVNDGTVEARKIDAYGFNKRATYYEAA